MRGRAGALAALSLVVMGAYVLLIVPVELIVTTGSSMAPTFMQGDLALLRRRDEVRVGEIVAYSSPSLGGSTILHRVVALPADGVVTQGDDNSWTDPDQPLPSELLGTLVLRVPGGGAWWNRLTSPTLLGVVAFALIAVTGTPPAARRARRRRRRAGTSARSPRHP